MSRSNIFACDIDNTVSCQYERFRRFYDSKANIVMPQAFEEREIMKDVPMPGSIDAIARISKIFKIVWITARHADQYDMTQRWLKKNGFHIDDLILVEKINAKIPILIQLNPYVYVDDMKYDYINMDPKMMTEFVKQLDDSGIRYEIFNNNWREIADKYLNMIGK
ncbi:hypothetical protein ACFL42_00405 [Candidatus Omnitrophota bacterium]